MSDYIKCFREEFIYHTKTLDLFNEEDVKFLSIIKTQSLNDPLIFIKTEIILQDRYMLFSWIETKQIEKSPLEV